MNKKSPNPKKNKPSKKTYSKHNLSAANRRLQYKFWILIGVLILAGISIVLRLETPVIWTFLYGIGGWAALTTNPGGSLR